MSYRLIVSHSARADLARLYDHVLQRELNRSDGDLDLAEQAIETIEGALGVLRRYPFTCRRADESPFLRELLVPFGRAGYVVLFDISSDTEVTILAVRHQREDDYH